ncbi:glycosyl hydrolase family 18 protein [Paenibacillus aurantiacus]|uniref:chitinase n=1 Tax=Paenibacillus aurantiacus TaxID=1936118 RepID=A0ABV5KT54_9BACL
MAYVLCFAIVFSLFGASLASAAEPADYPIPQNLHATDVKADSVVLNWDPVPGNDSNLGYQIYMKVGESGGWGWKAWSGFSPKLIVGLDAEKTYSFYVTQVPEIGKQSKPSNIVTITTPKADPTELPPAPLTPPQYLRVSSLVGSELQLSWTPSPRAVGYEIYRGESWFRWIEGGETTSTSINLEELGLKDGDTVNFRIRAQDSLRLISAMSNRVTLTLGQLSAPQGVKIVSANQSSVALGWGPVQGATSYEIYQDATLVGTSTSNRFAATGLTEGQAYNFSVVAKNESWTSEASAPIRAVPGSDYNLVTYYTSWARSETGRNYVPADLAASNYTHINYAFLDFCWSGKDTSGDLCQNADLPLQKDYVFDGGIVLGDPSFDLANFSEFEAVKAANPQLNMIATVGGWSWSKNFSLMAASEETRRNFANTAVKVLRAYDFDGLDIDWEYPVSGGADGNIHSPDDPKNFTLLMRTVREALDAAGSEDGKYYLLTIASSQSDSFPVNADFPNSTQYLDFVNIMTYDFSGSWEKLAHHNSPVYYDDNHPYKRPRSTVRGGALGHLNAGLPAYKLVLGVPFYGKGWTGCPPQGQYQTCEGMGEGTWESGLYDYYDIQNNYVDKNGYTRYWNEKSKVAYVYNPDTKLWIGYNDETTMMYTSSLVKTLDLAGVMSWDSSGDMNDTLSTQLAKDLRYGGQINASELQPPTGVKIEGASLTWEPAAGAAGYEIFRDDVYVGYTTDASFALTGLTPEQTYKFHLLSIRKDGEAIAEVSAASQAVTYQAPSQPLDTIAPATELLANGAAAAAWYKADHIAISLNASDNEGGSGVAKTYYRINGGSEAEYTAPFQLTGAVSYTVTYYSRDGAGNVEQEKSVTLKVDTVAPVTKYSVSPVWATKSGVKYIKGYTWTLSATDNAAGSGVKEIKYRVNGGAWTTYTAPFVPTSANGSVNVEFYGVDNAGNQEIVKK